MSDPTAPQENSPLPPAPPLNVQESTPYAAAPGPDTSLAATRPPVLSIVSLAAGILGLLTMLTGWGLIVSAAAVVTGHIARSREKRGKAFSLAGIITGYLGFVLGVIILAGIALFLGIVDGLENP